MLMNRLILDTRYDDIAVVGDRALASLPHSDERSKHVKDILGLANDGDSTAPSIYLSFLPDI